MSLQTDISSDELLPKFETSENVVEIKELVAGYKGKVVWQGANFAIKRGEFVTIIGPNGAGKTTLFRLLLGILQPMTGTVKILGAEPKRGNPLIGYVPQRHLVDNDTSFECLELVKLAHSGNRWGSGIFSANADRIAALDALGAVGATQLAHKSLGALSGGELQRVFLAEALVSNPQILLLDEPLSHLDIRRSKELVDLVNKLVRTRNVTALLVAHDINPVLPFLDKVIYVANEKVATGRPEEVLTSESLSELYGVRIEVIRDSRGNVAIIGVDDHHGHHHDHHENVHDHHHEE